MDLNTLLQAPAHTPSPLREVYDLVADAVYVACGFRLKMGESEHDVENFKAAALALAHTRHDANEALQDSEIWLRANAVGVWEACRAALEAIEPVNHACAHVLPSFGVNARDHLGWDCKPCPAFESCRKFTGDTQTYFAAVPPVDERALLERMRRETITVSSRLNAALSLVPSTPTTEPLTPTPAPTLTAPLKAQTPPPAAAGADRQQNDPSLPDRPDPEYQLRLVGEVWHIRYRGEEGDYPAKGNKAIGWLAKLLAAPNRLLTVADLCGDPDGKLTADAMMGNEREADAAMLCTVKKRLDEINEITDDTGGSEALEQERIELLDKLKTATNPLNTALKNAHSNIATQLRTFRREKLAEDMPLLADHLKAFVKLHYPTFGYYPSAPSPAWQI